MKLFNKKTKENVEIGKIIGIGINYYDFVESISLPIPSRPYIFYKPNTTLIESGEKVLLPNDKDLITFEGEIAVIIGEKCRYVKEEDVERYILGYTLANDITNKKDFQEDGHMGLAKSYDTFTPIYKFYNGELKLKDLNKLTFNTYQNGEVKQIGNLENLIFKIPKLIAFLSNVMTLNKGDIILTGSPAGPDKLIKSDIIEIEMDQIGTLKNTIA